MTPSTWGSQKAQETATWVPDHVSPPRGVKGLGTAHAGGRWCKLGQTGEASSEANPVVLIVFGEKNEGGELSIYSQHPKRLQFYAEDIWTSRHHPTAPRPRRLVRRLRFLDASRASSGTVSEARCARCRWSFWGGGCRRGFCRVSRVISCDTSLLFKFC